MFSNTKISFNIILGGGGGGEGWEWGGRGGWEGGGVGYIRKTAAAVVC
jgi:hypothetical protein